MASNILPAHLSLHPMFPPLAGLPGAASDERRAALYVSNEGGVRYDSPSGMMFWFSHEDGAVDWFTEEELRAQTWWYWLPERSALSIEAHLFPLPYAEPPIWYVARCDRARNGKLITGSRLSAYFEGEGARAAADAHCKQLVISHPDAGVFGADSVDEAEQLLASEDPGRVGSMRTKERMTTARLERFRMDDAAPKLPAVS